MCLQPREDEEGTSYSEEDDEDEQSDNLDLYYPDDENYDVVENKAKDTELRVVAPLHPAGSLQVGNGIERQEMEKVVT